MTILHPSDPFPALTVKLPDGGSLRLPDALAGHFGVMLFYRGSWCPCCNAQPRATTQDVIARHGVQFPVGHSADAHAIAHATGVFVNPGPVYL